MLATVVNDLGQCRVYVLLLQCCGVSESMKALVGFFLFVIKKNMCELKYL